MNLRWIWMGHLRVMRQRWTRTLLSVLAVGAGSALLVGVVVSDHSIKTSLTKFNRSASFGAALRVEGPADHGSLDAVVLPAVAATPGVKAAVPLVVSVLEAADSKNQALLVPVLGVDCGIEAIVGAFGCDPVAMRNAPDTPVLGVALQRRLGPKGVLRTNVTDIPTAGAFAVRRLETLNHGMVAVFPLAASQRHLTRPNGFDAILVLPEDGADLVALRRGVARAVGPQNHVLDASSPLGGGGFATVTSTLTPFLFLLSLIGLVIGAQLVRNTLDLSLEERRRELATTSALGATPRDIRLGILTEGAVVGILGSALAVVGGGIIASVFVSRLSEELAKASGLRATVSVPPLAVVLGLVVAVGVSSLSSLAPARRAARIDLVAELSGRGRFEVDRATSSRRLAVTGLLVATAMGLGWLGQRGGSLAAWQPAVSLVALVGGLVVGYVACVQLAPLLLARLQRAPGFQTGPGRIALTNIIRARRRTAAIAIAITAPVLFTTLLGGMTPGMADAARSLAQGVAGDAVWVSTLPSNNSSDIDSKITPEMERGLASVLGVGAIEHQYWVAYNDPQAGRFSIDGFEGGVPRYHVHRGGDPEDVFARGEIMIGPALARSGGIRPGDRFSIAARVGPRQSFVVGGVWASPDSQGRSVTMRADQLVALVGPRALGSLALLPARGVTADELAARVHAANISDRLRIMTTDELADDFSREFLKLASPFDALRGALVVVALVATASTLVLAAAQRRRDNATLAALGMSPADLARSTMIETVVTALAVTVIATMCGQLALINFTWASALMTGLPIPYRFSAGPVIFAALATSLIALIGAVLPAWRTARTNVMDALRTA